MYLIHSRKTHKGFHYFTNFRPFEQKGRCANLILGQGFRPNIYAQNLLCVLNVLLNVYYYPLFPFTDNVSIFYFVKFDFKDTITLPVELSQLYFRHVFSN